MDVEPQVQKVGRRSDYVWGDAITKMGQRERAKVKHKGDNSVSDLNLNVP